KELRWRMRVLERTIVAGQTRGEVVLRRPVEPSCGATIRDIRRVSEELLARLSQRASSEEASQPPPAGSAGARPGEPEARRYTDLTLVDGDLFLGDDLTSALRVRDDQPLVAGGRYTLEVAIRLKRTGIEADRDPGGPVQNPREDREDLTVWVRV